MLTGAMLGLIEQLGLDVLTLTQEVSEAEFFASRLTRKQTLLLLESMAKTVENLPVGVRERLPEIDWQAWLVLAYALSNPAHHPLQIWVAVKELTPLTLQHLNACRKTQPGLFSIVP